MEDTHQEEAKEEGEEEEVTGGGVPCAIVQM